jgi:GBP family porin
MWCVVAIARWAGCAGDLAGRLTPVRVLPSFSFIEIGIALFGVVRAASPIQTVLVFKPKNGGRSMKSNGQFLCTGTRSIARHRLLAVLAGGCLGFAGTASAEAEVALYGEIDAGLTYTSSVAADEQAGLGKQPPHSRLAATSNNVGGSFFGLHGTEDLGGGATAEFTIERGINVTDGTGNDGQPMFVGLSHPEAGTLTLGRQADSVSDYLAPLTLTGSEGGTYFAHPFDNDNANATYLINHSVKWRSPQWYGFHFGGQYAVSPVSSGVPAWSAGAAFAKGPLSLAASYAQSGGVPLEDDLGTAIGNALTGPGMTPAPGALGGRIYGTGINYALGDVTLGTAWTHSRYEARGHGDGPGMNGTGRVDIDNYEINTRYQASAALMLAAAYTLTQSKASSGNTQTTATWNQFGLQADYAVSKRTNFYVEGVFQLAADDQPIAFVNGVEAADSDRQTVMSVGVRHHF